MCTFCKVRAFQKKIHSSITRVSVRICFDRILHFYMFYSLFSERILTSCGISMAGLELLSDQGFRIDGRRSHELRKIQCKLGVFSQADGSAYVEQGNTKVLAAVYGPHEVRSIFKFQMFNIDSVFTQTLNSKETSYYLTKLIKKNMKNL